MLSIANIFLFWYEAEDLCFSCDVQHQKYRVYVFYSVLVVTSTGFFNANFYETQKNIFN